MENLNNAEIIKKAMDDFKTVQNYMLAAREENAVKTYNLLKIDYLNLKSFLTVMGVNLTPIDVINE